VNRAGVSLAAKGNVSYINPQISRHLKQGDADGFVVMLIWFWRSGIRLHGSFLKNEVTRFNRSQWLANGHDAG